MKLSYLLLLLFITCVTNNTTKGNEYAKKIKLYIESDLEIYVSIKIEYLKKDYNIALKTTELYWSFNEYEKTSYKKEFSIIMYNLLISNKALIVDKIQFDKLRKHIVEKPESISYTKKEIINSLDEYGCIKYSYKEHEFKSIIFWLVEREIIVTATGNGPCFSIEMLD